MEYLGTKAAAAQLNLSESTVRRLFTQGVLAGFVTPGGHRKIAKASVEELLKKRDTGITFP